MDAPNGRSESRAIRLAHRNALVDALRGVALLGMLGFHLAWDLAYLHLSEIDPVVSPAWRMFGDLVAASFLVLSGYAMVLAAPKGTVAALRRLARVAAAALLVTAVTAALFPEDAIMFGVLHCIAVTNAIALPLLRAPLALVVALAAVAVWAPYGLGSAEWDQPGWVWLGLSSTLPRTLDFRPVLPWLGAVLLGQCLGRLFAPAPMGPLAFSAPARALAWAGRHSLPLYLIHQPVLLAGLVPLAGFLAPPADFVSRCRAQCVAAGAEATVCAAACACAAAHVQAGVNDRSSAPSTDVLRSAGAACLDALVPRSR